MSEKRVKLLLTCFLISLTVFSTLPLFIESGSCNSNLVLNIEPNADTYVDGKYHWKNKGSSSTLAVWAYGDEYISFLKFDLTNIPLNAEIVSAELFLRVKEYSVDSSEASVIGVHHYSDDSWNETQISWDAVDWNALNQTPIDTTEIYVDKLQWQVWFNWTVTSNVKNATGSSLSLALMAENNVESIFFYSRETTMKPYLKVTIAEASNVSGTTVGGIIWSDTTWTLADSPYTITEEVQIPEGVTLTIEPGVVVNRSTSGSMFLVQGTIYAHGTIDNKIIFDGGGNSDIFYFSGLSYADLDYCIIKNGDHLWTTECHSLNLTHCELTNLKYYSYLHIYHTGREIYIEYNKFINTGGFLISCYGNDVNVYVRYNLFTGKNTAHSNFYIGSSTPIEYSSHLIVKYNSFIFIDGTALLISHSSRAAMSATENYFGTQDTNVIDSLIHDRNDDIYCTNYVEYLPILSESHPDTPKISTSISCSISLNEVNIENPITISGFITPVLSGKTVTLTYQRPDASSVIRTVMTGSDGSYSDTYTPDMLSMGNSWSVFASWDGDSNYVGASSPIYLFTVTKISSTLQCAVSSSEITKDDSITISVLINPSVSGKTITLTYNKPDGSTFTRTVTTNQDGFCSDSYTPDVAGSWSVTASWNGDSTHEGASSSEEDFTVNTSFIGGPGWVDDIAVFGGIGLIVIASLIIILRKIKR